MNKITVIIQLALMITGIFLINPLSAEPYSIHDTGKTQSMALYMPSVNPPDKRTLLQSAVKPRGKTMKRLPVSTPELTPGKVTTKKIKSYLDTPFFIVGADPLSNQWLIQNHRQLKKLNAIGIAVNVRTNAELSRLQRSSGGLRISPVPGKQIAKNLGLKHYPVLVSGKLIEQ